MNGAQNKIHSNGEEWTSNTNYSFNNIISDDDVLCQLNKLIIGSRNRYIKQYRSGDVVNYAEVKCTLSDRIVREHLAGKRTVGCFYCGKASKFLVFDIDDTDEIKVKGIISTLRRIGVDSNHIHVEDSGNKGYHVWLFFSDPLPIKKLVSFGQWTISQLGEYRDHIELRPESVRGRGVKLPFAIHQKTGRRTTFLDHITLEPYVNQYEYFLSINPISRDEMDRIIDEALQWNDVRLERLPLESTDQRLERAEKELKNVKPPINKNSKLRALAERLIRDGISDEDLAQGHGRHYSQFFVAAYYKEQGFDEQDVTRLTIEWALREKAAGRAESSEAHISRDVAKDVRHIFKNDKGLWDSAGRPYQIYQSDVLYASQFKRRAVRKVLWAMIIWGRIYAENGVFFMSQRDIESMSGVSLKSVNKIVNELIADGAITLVERGKQSKNDRQASTYYIPLLDNANENEAGETIHAETYTELFDQSYRCVEMAG